MHRWMPDGVRLSCRPSMRRRSWIRGHGTANVHEGAVVSLAAEGGTKIMAKDTAGEQVTEAMESYGGEDRHAALVELHGRHDGSGREAETQADEALPLGEACQDVVAETVQEEVTQLEDASAGNDADQDEGQLDDVSYSLNSLKGGLYRGLYRGLL